MPFTPGETVGSYRIIEQLGRGGMATVYKAYHAPLDRDVAIKVLHPAFKSDPQFFARFQREARIVAKLEHSNIVPVYDFSEHEGEPYLVMRYVQGDTLKPHLQGGALSPAETLRLMRPVCNALAYAHNQGVLHRDIKPSNIMLTPDGGVYLTDFGLARMVQAGESTLSQDMMVGTPQYISPEQAQGEKDLDGRTDIYSLGVVLFEMLTGSVPFSGDTPFAVVHDHIYKPLPLPNSINPDVDPQAEKVILRALAKDKGDRFEKVQDLWLALEDALASQVSQVPTVAAPIEDKSEPAPKRMSSKKKFVIAGVVTLLLVCICVLAMIANNAEKEEQQLPQVSVSLEPSSPPVEPSLPPVEPSPPPVEPPPPSPDGETSPQSAEDFLHEGDMLLEQGDLMGALNSFLQAVDANPRFIPAYIAVSETFLALDQPLEAADILKAGIEYNPKQVNFRLLMARYQMEANRWPEARRTLEGALEIDPDNALAHVGLARIAVAEDNLDATEAHLTEARQIAPDLPEIRVVEARLLWRQGDKYAAVEMLREVAQNPKLSKPVREELHRLFQEYGAELP